MQHSNKLGLDIATIASHARTNTNSCSGIATYPLYIDTKGANCGYMLSHKAPYPRSTQHQNDIWTG